MNLKELREIAERATPGPWTWDSGDCGAEYPIPYRGVSGKGDNPVADDVKIDADAIFISTFDPPTVLRLIELAEKAEILARETFLNPNRIRM